MNIRLGTQSGHNTDQHRKHIGPSQPAMSGQGTGPLVSPGDRKLVAYRGYAAFAADNPALYQMMFVGADRNGQDPDLNLASEAALDVLRDICARQGGAETNELMIWSLVHGFASLALTDNSGRIDINDAAQLEAILPPLRFTDKPHQSTKDLT